MCNNNMPNDNRIETKIEGYKLLVSHQASLSDCRKVIGQAGCCRFCGETDSKLFQQRAHMIPESLGNKWLFSADECDRCNKLFGRYDQAFADAVGAVLTMGGTKGKKNRIRKTGRTGGISTVRRKRGFDGRPQLSVMSGNVDFEKVMKHDSTSGFSTFNLPLPPTPFHPRHAYKSLCKMGIALLPQEELPAFQKLIAWLQDPIDSEPFIELSVNLAFGMIGNASPIASVALLRRNNLTTASPYMLFILSVGSVCCAIDLMPDTLDNHIPPVIDSRINVAWKSVLRDEPGKPDLVINYENPVSLNWASSDMHPQPIESMTLVFNSKTTQGRFTPNYRDQS